MVRFRSSVFFRTFTIVVFAALSLALGAVFVPAQEAKQASGAKPQAGARGGPEAKQPDKEGWISLFDGKSLGDWKVVAEADFERHGEVLVENRQILLKAGLPATGVKWTGKFPKIDYEIALEAMRVEGDDFFCGLTFPVGDKWLTLVCGGWGGQATGLSNIDGDSAIDNQTCTFQEYKQKQWYRIRVRWPRIESAPGSTRSRSSTWNGPTGSFRSAGRSSPRSLGNRHLVHHRALRNIRFRPLAGKPDASPKEPDAKRE